MEKLEDLVYLQVYGLNKLEKEIQESNRDNRDRIDFDEEAIHRNEMTGEKDDDDTEEILHKHCEMNF